MSTSLTVVGKQVIIYMGIPLVTAGVVGGILNIIVFLSLQTFRQSSCAFYLTIMSILSIGQLVFGFFPQRILNALFDSDGTDRSLFFCKFRVFVPQLCLGGSLTCFCLATIDQYLATCIRPRWQQLCNIKLAHRLVMASILFWMLHGIPFLVYFNHFQSPAINRITCSSINSTFNDYRSYFFILILIGYLPIVIAALFGSLAYRNTQHMSYRTIPLVRRELDKQLTTMVLIQVLVNIFTLLPYTTVNALITNTSLTSNPVIQANLQFTLTVVNVNYNIYFSSPFYIYICASERFRKQFLYVLFKICCSRWKQPRIGNNQVIPEA